MSDPLDPLDDHVARHLGELPLDPQAARRVRGRLGAEVEARRLEVIEGALHGGFAIAALAWTLLVLVK